jgi:Family of unknown function (DUF6183)
MNEMNEDVCRLLSGIETVRDVNEHWRVIDRWIAQQDHVRLGDLADALASLVSNATPQCWQPGSLRNHLLVGLARSSGLATIDLVLSQMLRPETSTRQLREIAARLASVQEPEVIIAALERHEFEPGLAEFLYVLTHEAVIRRKIGPTTPVADRMAAQMSREGHPLVRLPLELFDLESAITTYLPWYVPQGGTVVSGYGLKNSQEPRTTLATAISLKYSETTTPDVADRAVEAVRNWIEESAGITEVRLFEFEEPLPTDALSPALLRSLGLDCVVGLSENAIQFAEIAPSQGFGHLFSAATSGGAYSSGEGAAYGRLAAWESAAALVGNETGDLTKTSEVAENCVWFAFLSNVGWFYDVAWDLGLAVLRPDRRTLVILAATDTD